MAKDGYEIMGELSETSNQRKVRDVTQPQQFVEPASSYYSSSKYVPWHFVDNLEGLLESYQKRRHVVHLHPLARWKPNSYQAKCLGHEQWHPSWSLARKPCRVQTACVGASNTRRVSLPPPETTTKFFMHAHKHPVEWERWTVTNMTRGYRTQQTIRSSLDWPNRRLS